MQLLVIYTLKYKIFKFTCVFVIVPDVIFDLQDILLYVGYEEKYMHKN